MIKVFWGGYIRELFLVPPTFHRRPVEPPVFPRPELEVHEKAIGLQVHQIIFHLVVQTVDRPVDHVNHRVKDRGLATPHGPENPEQPSFRQAGKIYRLALPI